MKPLNLALCAMALIAFAGCQYESTTQGDGNTADTTKVSKLDADLCGKCGCCAGCEDCCNEDIEKCSCGFNKGSALCCVEGLKPSDVKYCKDCGFEKGSESCCAKGSQSCSKCGLAKGAPLCCKLKDKDAAAAKHDENHEGEHDDEEDHDDEDHDEHESDSDDEEG